MRILIVEDSPEMQLTLKSLLPDPGLDVVCVTCAADAKKSLTEAKADLILLDVSLPDQDGFQFYSELQSRAEARPIPVIFITGKGDVTNKVAAFALGAEDYIVKPFDHLEVRARLQARLKKIESQSETASFLEKGRLQIDVSKQRAYVNDASGRHLIQLTPKEFLLLAHLARNEEKVISRNQLLDAVWGSDSAVFDRTVDTHISSIRKKLGDASGYIESVPGVGYRFSSAAKLA
jgi:DNA-binding response OmpR family regulator